MSESERKSRTTYHACRHAIRAVDAKLARRGKSIEEFRDALSMERQGYVDLANEIAKELGLESVSER